MKSKIDKSLVEVWEMKEAAWESFLTSGYKNYVDYINHSLKEVKEIYNFKYWKEMEKEKQITSA